MYRVRYLAMALVVTAATALTAGGAMAAGEPGITCKYAPTRDLSAYNLYLYTNNGQDAPIQVVVQKVPPICTPVGQG